MKSMRKAPRASDTVQGYLASLRLLFGPMGFANCRSVQPKNASPGKFYTRLTLNLMEKWVQFKTKS